MAIKNIISSTREVASVYIQCMCGNEILWLYFYKATRDEDEIIGMNYLCNQVKIQTIHNSLTNHFSFDRLTLGKFIEALEKINNHGISIKNGKSILLIDRNESGVVQIYKAESQKGMDNKNFVWDITLENNIIPEIIDKLKEFKKVVDENEEHYYQ